MTPQNNDWMGMFYAIVIGIAFFIIMAQALFGDQLHYWIADLIK